MANSTLSSKDALCHSYDVLFHIFSSFLPSEPFPTTLKWRQQLLNLALVCKAFLDPAMDCLWSHMDSLETLLKLHPAICRVTDSYCFRGDMDSLRFRQYAQRVRTIHIKDGSDSYRIGDTGYAWLGRKLRGGPLLPGLRNIRFESCKAKSPHIGLLPLTLFHTIERVEFGGGFFSVPLFHEHALSLICDDAPSLKHLVLHDEYSAGTSLRGHQCWDTLIKLANRLRVLIIRFPRLSAPNAPTSQRLFAGLRNLTSLTLDFHTPSHTEALSASTGPVLPKLQQLHLINRSGAQLCPCYPPFLLEKATSITFSLNRSIQSDRDFEEALETLSTMPALRSVEINGSNLSLPSTSIAPFLRRLRLEEFRINTRALKHRLGMEPGRQILLIIAHEVANDSPRNHPLQRLMLPIWRETVDFNGFPCEAAKYPSLTCLVDVAQRIRGLQRLSLSIDSSGDPNDETVSSLIRNWVEPDTPSSLKYLEIAEMRNPQRNFTPSEYRDIAQLLNLIFPNLISVTVVKDGRLSNRWDEHWELIEEYRQMRRQLGRF